jgi:hypothetical protein
MRAPQGLIASPVAAYGISVAGNVVRNARSTGAFHGVARIRRARCEQGCE